MTYLQISALKGNTDLLKVNEAFAIPRFFSMSFQTRYQAETLNEIDNDSLKVVYTQTMNVSFDHFDKIVTEITNKVVNSTASHTSSNKYYFTGHIGMGKSYFLAFAALKWKTSIEDKHKDVRVLYIHDCEQLMISPFKYFLDELLITFSADVDIKTAIETAQKELESTKDKQ